MATTTLTSAALTQSVSIETLLFDLDGTLYPIENGYEDHVRCVPLVHLLLPQRVAPGCPLAAKVCLHIGKTFTNLCIKGLVCHGINAKPSGGHYLQRQTKASRCFAGPPAHTSAMSQVTSVQLPMVSQHQIAVMCRASVLVDINLIQTRTGIS